MISSKAPHPRRRVIRNPRRPKRSRSRIRSDRGHAVTSRNPHSEVFCARLWACAGRGIWRGLVINIFCNMKPYINGGPAIGYIFPHLACGLVEPLVHMPPVLNLLASAHAVMLLRLWEVCALDKKVKFYLHWTCRYHVSICMREQTLNESQMSTRAPPRRWLELHTCPAAVLSSVYGRQRGPSLHIDVYVQTCTIGIPCLSIC